jgi:hypothetical protein
MKINSKKINMVMTNLKVDYILDPKAKNIYVVTMNDKDRDIDEVATAIYQAASEKDVYDDVITDGLYSIDPDDSEQIEYMRENMFVDIKLIGILK